MKNFKICSNYIANLIFLCTLIIFTSIISNITFANSVEKTNFWNKQQKGANIFNSNVTLDDIKAAKKYGVKFIRLAPDKFISSHRDFLIGDADNYRALIKADLEKFKQVLDICYQEQMPVVITMLSLPGSRWKQNNQGKDDLRIWKNHKYQIQAAQFWQDLADILKDHPAIVGYNPLNEPHPERIFPIKKDQHVNEVNQNEVQEMLYAFYDRIIKNIRLVDKNTPIILDSSSYADAKTFNLLKFYEDKNILYSFHIYEPYEYTNYKTNKGKFKYPGVINGKNWDKNALKEYVSAVVSFQKKNNLASNRILVGEFGGHRMSSGLDQYFRDLISIFNEQNWHFAFYAFREDTWDGMDYELGNKKLPGSYWVAIERGQKPVLERKSTYPAFSVIKEALNQ